MIDISTWIESHRQEIAEWALVAGPAPSCMVTDCPRTAHSHGICKSHYHRAKRAWQAEVRREARG